MTPIRRQVRGQRSPSSWVRHVDVGPFDVPVANKALLAVLALSNPGIGETVRRTRGFVAVHTGVAGDRLGALGLVVVSDLAIAAGAASIPGPFTDRSDDGWFVWQPTGGNRPLATMGESTIWEWDSRAMRRVEEGFGIAVMYENANLVSPTIKVEVGFSQLTSIS